LQGLSSLALLDAFPRASVTGVDLSPHFLAMALYEQRRREVRATVLVNGAGGEWVGGPVGRKGEGMLCLTAFECVGVKA
jgi:methylase of polypeptide subunit release factors